MPDMKNEIQHRKSTRLKEYDYSNAGYYFVTICSAQMKHQFGEIRYNKMIFNNTGNIINNFWPKIPEHFNNVELDYYQLMPNHLHGIIIIDSIDIVGDGSPVPKSKSGEGEPFPYEKKNSLCDIIGYFKYQTTKAINNLYNTPRNKIWQRSFYDRIIRNEKELYSIRKYIQQNPLKWEIEKNTSENLMM